MVLVERAGGMLQLLMPMDALMLNTLTFNLQVRLLSRTLQRFQIATLIMAQYR